MLAPTRFVITALFVFCTVSSATPTVAKSIKERATAATGWYQRAKAYPNASFYKVEEKKLVYGAIRSTRLYPDYFTVALFKPNVAVDSRGQVLAVKKQDFDILAGLAKQTTNLPSTGQFRNLWSVKRGVSDLAIYYISATKSGTQHTNSVYGHDGVTTKLDPPVDHYKNLPESLNALISLSKEADASSTSTTQNDNMIAQVKAVIHLD